MTPAPRLVLLGGGHSHVEVLRRFAMRGPGIHNVTLIARDMLAPYSGMLPGFISGQYTFAEAHIDVRPLARAAGAHVCHAEVESIDLDMRMIACTGRPGVPFDLLSINVGSRPTLDDVPGAREFAWPAKPVDVFIANWERLLDDLTARPRPHRVVVVGGGAGGVELALAMRRRLGAVVPGTTIALITANDVILPTHSDAVRRHALRALNRHGILVHTAARAAEVVSGEVRCASGRAVPFDTLIWTTHAAPLPWLRDSGLATDDRGFVLVDEHLRSVSHPFVFAAGDTASLRHAPRPKSGVFAVREGPILATNLARALTDKPLESFMPQKQHLALLGTGDGRAIASRGSFAAEGKWVARWKDRIDRAWMAKYQRAMPMPRAIPASRSMGDMPCAGCGAKLGHDVLHRALARLQTVPRPDVLIGLDAPDDAAVVELPHGMLAVHTVDVFPALVADPYLAGRIAAVHCLSDIYAMGAAPHTALAVVTLPETHEAVQEDTLTDLLAGALSVLMPEHAALVGGHTLEGDRLDFGLSVNGVIARDRLLKLGGPRPGDRLILTKPLGIGTIFAADMRGMARAHWVADAVAHMTHSNAAAAHILFDHGATTCTDVTGFGLAGHLVQLLHKHGASASIEWDTVPLLPGAVAATRAGVRSTLYPSNALIDREIDAAPQIASRDTYPLLFDPQTAGGLLAAVPADRACACVAALHAAGYALATIIGSVEPPSMNEKSIRIE